MFLSNYNQFNITALTVKKNMANIHVYIKNCKNSLIIGIAYDCSKNKILPDILTVLLLINYEFSNSPQTRTVIY